MRVSLSICMRNCTPIVALISVFSTSCAIIEIERDGVVIERRVSVLAPSENQPVAADGVLVSRLRVLGFSQQGTSTTLGYLSGTYVQVVDPSKCSLLVLIEQDTGLVPDLVAQLSTIAKSGCVVTMRPKEKS